MSTRGQLAGAAAGGGRRPIRELRQLERDLAELGSAGKGLDPAQRDPSGICGVISLQPAIRGLNTSAEV